MATCNFCQQQFENAQSVRAHLKGCSAYRQRDSRRAPKGSPGESESLGIPGADSEAIVARGYGSAEYDEVAALEKQLASARLRLKLRGVEAAHRELDERQQAKANEQQTQREAQRRAEDSAIRAREETRRREEQAKAERGAREAAERGKAERRRAAIQNAKQDAIRLWWPSVPDITALKAEVLSRIEGELAKLSVEELPPDELLLIAQGVRDRLTREAEGRARDAQRTSANRQKLIRHGTEYAARELKTVDGLDAFERLRITAKVQEELSGIAGDETTLDIEEMVEGVLEDEGIAWDDSDADEEDEYEDS
jgi:hypothetical protein